MSSEPPTPHPSYSIGTPLTPSATRVMLLGSGELSKELAIAFHRLGVEVHAADRVRYAPAQQVAHVAHTVDVADSEAVRALIAHVRPHIIVPEIDRVSSRVLEAVEETQGSWVAPTAQATARCINREELREWAAEELGLPTTSYRFVSDFTGFEVAIGSIGYPCIAKPDFSGPGARPHVVINGPDEVESAWDQLVGEGYPDLPARRVVVEKVVDFDYEIALIAIRSIDPATGKDATWFCEPIGLTYTHGCYQQAWQPTAMSSEAMENARSVAARVCTGLGGRGVFCVKMFVAGDDVYFSEVTPRPHDTGLVTLVSQRFSQFELHARAVLGLPIDSTLVSPGAVVLLNSPVEAHEVRYRGLDRALAIPEVAVELFGKQNATVGRQMGVVAATGETVADALDRAREAARAIVIESADDQEPDPRLSAPRDTHGG